MPSDSPPEVKLEIGHVLFIDIVGYSQLLITQQSEQIETLRRIVRGTAQFRSAEAEGKLLRLPTGDGGALVFRTTPEAPVLCALEIANALKNHPELRVRMGIHSGPVNAITDLNEQANIAGAGINIAQRVMDYVSDQRWEPSAAFTVAPSARPQQNTEAYDLYLQGLYLSNKSDEENLRKSLTFFQRALDIDPNFARAWTGVAKAWLWLADAYVKPIEAYPKVREAAKKALALDERDAEAHTYLSETKRVLDRDLPGEEKELKRALEIDPNSAPAHLFMALLKTAQWEFADGVKDIREAERLDPLAPVICSFAVGIYLSADRIDDAIEAGKRIARIDPNYVYVQPDLANAYREKGDFQKAIELYEKAQETTHFPSAGLAITYAKMGRRQDAHGILEQLIEKSRQQYVAADVIAGVYAALGEKDEAFRWLDRAFEEHSASMVSFTSYPEFRSLRSDPRFADLLRRIGIDPARVLSRQKKE